MPDISKLSERERKLFRTMNKMRRVRLWDLTPGMKRGEAVLLDIICSHEKGLKVSDMTEKAEMLPPAASRLMKSMEEQGLIRRSVNPEDRRNVVVLATEKGQKQNAQIQELIHLMWMDVFEEMGRENVDRFMDLWDTFINCMCDAVQKRKADTFGSALDKKKQED